MNTALIVPRWTTQRQPRSHIARRVSHLAFVVSLLACEHPDARRSTTHSESLAATTHCARPPRGIIISLDTVAGFSTHATLGALRRQCAVGQSDLYDAVGYQTVAWNFPFAGATVQAAQTKHNAGDVMRDDETPDLWTVEGDSARMPGGELVPRTLGSLRARYGFTLAEDRPDGDDMDGPFARSCRFPYLRFMLAANDTARHTPDSARVTRVDMVGPDTAMVRYCRAHRPPNEP